MAIYISGVKGLPEQVQANKEDIERIKTDIENIDFDAIRHLEVQVDENTNDINNLENGQGVQDQAINSLNGRVGIAEDRVAQVESDTRKITYNETDDETRIQGTTRIAVIKNNRIGDDDSIITFGTANGIELRQGNHILNYDNDGKLYLDGVEIQPVAPTLPKYQHNITLYSATSNITLKIINGSNNAMTISDLTRYLYNNTLRTVDKLYQVSGYNGEYSNPNVVVGMYADGIYSLFLRCRDTQTSSWIDTSIGGAFVIQDVIIEI